MMHSRTRTASSNFIVNNYNKFETFVMGCSISPFGAYRKSYRLQRLSIRSLWIYLHFPNNWISNCQCCQPCDSSYVKLYTEPLPTHLSDLDHFELFISETATLTASYTKKEGARSTDNSWKLWTETLYFSIPTLASHSHTSYLHPVQHLRCDCIVHVDERSSSSNAY